MSQNTKNNNETIDVKELFFSLLAQWKLIALCIVLCLICALLYLRVTPQVYSTDALVQVEDGKSAASAALLGGLKDLPSQITPKSPADAEIEILRSRMIIGQVIDNMNLDIQVKDNSNTLLNKLFSKDRPKTTYTHQAVTYQNGTSSIVVKQLEVPSYYEDKPLKLNIADNKAITLSFKDKVVFSGKLNQANNLAGTDGSWKVQIFSNMKANEKFTLTKHSLPTAVKHFLSNYSVSEYGKMTGVIGLSYQGQDRQLITEILNNVLKVYHNQNVERKTLESKQTLSFLDKRLPELKQQLEDSEIKFNRFREQYNTIDVTEESELLLKQNVELEKLKIDLQQQKAELSAKYTNDHPLMSTINSQLAEIDKKINDMTGSIKRLPETQRLYLQLYRDVKVNTELYTALLNNYQQLKVASAGEIGNVRIIDTAVEPIKPIKPKAMVTLLLGLLAGAFIGGFLSLLRSIMHRGIKDSSQIEHEFDLPVYATIPRSQIQQSRLKRLNKDRSMPVLAVKHSDDIAIESLRSIRTAIHFALSNAKNNVIMISGPAPEVGKSFISTNLAVILAQNNKKVLLIDADLRRGHLHKFFDQENQKGLSEYLNDQQNSLSGVIKATDVPGLYLLNRGKSPSNPSELLDSSRFADMLNQLSHEFDHILIDTPPILAVTDGIIISQHAGVNLIVARYGKSQLKELEVTLRRFEHAGVKINGFILNDIQRMNTGYSYGYNYTYAYKASKDDD